MRRYRVIVTPFAQDDIRDAYEWLLAENPVYAEKWFAGMREKTLGLNAFGLNAFGLNAFGLNAFGLNTLPESHALAPESGAFDREIRQLQYGRGTPWRVFFTVGGTTVRVLHVRPGSRDYWRP